MRWFRRKPRSSRHPSPSEAVDALAAGECMYAPLSTCSGQPGTAGLRTDDDPGAILVCSAHYGRLRTMPARDLDRLERTLLDAFTRPPEPAPERQERAELVYRRDR